jgi:CheY-like chemotaxis protein
MNKANTDMTVMVVDDTESIRELLHLQLQLLGYRVVEAANGQEAIEALGKEAPSLILMDLMMPVLDGLEATRLIRARSGSASPVIVAFTALKSRESKQLAFAAGCNDYVNKPLNMEELGSLLTRHLPAPAL